MNLIEHTVIEKCNEILENVRLAPRDDHTSQIIITAVSDVLRPMYRDGHLTDYSYLVHPSGDTLLLDLLCTDLTGESFRIVLPI